MIKVKIINPELLRPEFSLRAATEGSAGVDVRALLGPEEDLISGERCLLLEPREEYIFNLGFAVEIPPGTCIVVMARSSLGVRGFNPVNKLPLIDSDYRGELRLIMCYDPQPSPYNFSPAPLSIEHGERIAQLVHLPIIPPKIQIVQELSESSRGTGGYGSTGRG